MIDLEQKVKIKWNSYTRLYYESLGYNFTKIGEEFVVALNDVQPSSGVKVVAKCDCCGKEYYPSYKNYNVCHKKKQFDYCKLCASQSARDTMIKKYGVAHYQQTEECKRRKEESFMERYGVKNPSQLKEFQDKKIATNIEKFGTSWFVQSDNFKQMCDNKYGVDNPMKSREVQIKACDSFSKNGSFPISKEEVRLVNLLKDWYGEEKCYPCYTEGRLVLDCLLIVNNERIDIEYDGAYWHKDRKAYDRRRDEVIKKLGYKVLRVLSNGKMPTFEQIDSSIQYLLSGHGFAEIDLT